MSVTALCLALAVVVFALIGRPVTVPGWITNRAEALLADQLPHLDLTMGHLSIVIDDGLRPRIRAHALQLRAQESSSAIELEEVDITLSFADLLDGQIALSAVRISGVYVSLRRLEDGSFNVSLGQGDQTADAIDARTTLPDLGAELAMVLDTALLAPLTEVRLESLHLRYEDVRAGRGWTIDGGQARLQRDNDNVSISANLIALGARSYVSSLEMVLETSLTSRVSHFGLTFEDMPADDIASQSPALAWLGILQAPISGSLRASTDAEGTLGPTAVALQIGEGALQPSDQVQPIPFKSAHTYLTYDPVTQTLALDEFSLQADRVSAIAQGTATLGKMDLGFPREMVVQLQFSELEVNPNRLEDSPIALDSVFADLRLRLDPFELSVGQLVLSQQGQRLQLKGHMAPDGAFWDYGLDGQMTRLEKDAVLGAWPVTFKPGLRKWIAGNIHSIQLSDINLALRSRQEKPPDVYLDFQYHDLTMRFMKTMPLLQEARGMASFLRNQFMVGAEAGYVIADDGGKMDVTGTGFIVQDTRFKEAPARVRLVTKGAITSALSLLNRAPLSVMDKARLPVDLASGQVRGVGVLDLTLKKKIMPEDVRFDVDLVLDDLTTSHFIKDKVIAGSLTGNVTNERIVLEGNGTVGVVPVHARWESKIGPDHDGSSTLSGTAELSERAIEEFDVGFPANTFSGSATGQFRMDIARGKPPVFSLSSDLLGLGIGFEPLGWRKSQSVTGTLGMEMTIAKPVRVDAFSFEAPGLTTNGSVSLHEEGGLDRVNFEAFKVGNWLTGTGELRGRGGNRPPAIMLTSGRFDVRGLPTGAGSETQSSNGPLSATFQRVQISEDYYLKDFSGQFEDDGGFSGTFSGSFNGMAPIFGEMIAKDGGQAFKITSNRGGDMITALGVTKSSGPGDFLLHLLPGPQPGVFDGILAIQNVKIQEAPAFAELLNAVSIVGLIDQLSGPGILMTEIAGKFRISPDKLTVWEGSAVGPAMGISLDGIMNLTTRALDFQGALSPVYILNAVGRVISKKGEGLLAFTYRLQGTPDNLKVTVNPLSALTPGFLREIFRAPSEIGESPFSTTPTRKPKDPLESATR